MNFSKNKLVSFLFALVFAFTLIGCGEQGTTETAGQKLDAATKQAGETMDQAGEKGKEMMDETKEKVKEAGQ